MSSRTGFVKNEDGQSMVEYALIIALIAVAAIAMMIGVGSALLGSYGDSSNKLKDAFDGKYS